MLQSHVNIDTEERGLEAFEKAAHQIEQKKNSGAYSRKTIHEINNSLAKINNALWLMEREENQNTALFNSCRQIVENELEDAESLLNQEQCALN